MENIKTETFNNAIDSGVDLMGFLSDQISLVAKFYGTTQDQQLPTLCMAMLGNGDVKAAMVGWQDDDEKEEALNYLSHAMKNMGAIAYAILSESWIVETKDPSTIDCLPSEHPDRAEAVIITVATKTDTLTSAFKIIRDGSGKVETLHEAFPVARGIAGKTGNFGSLLVETPFSASNSTKEGTSGVTLH